MKAILVIFALFSTLLFTACSQDSTVDSAAGIIGVVEIKDIQGNWIETERTCAAGDFGIPNALLGIAVKEEAHAYAHLKDISPSPAVHLHKVDTKHLRKYYDVLKFHSGKCTYSLKLY